MTLGDRRRESILPRHPLTSTPKKCAPRIDANTHTQRLRGGGSNNNVIKIIFKRKMDKGMIRLARERDMTIGANQEEPDDADC